MKNKKIYIIIFVVVILVLGGFWFFVGKGINETVSVPDLEEKEIDLSSSDNSNSEESGWINAEIKNVLTGESFRIADFKGKSVLLESFAVWCPTCLKQQKEMKKLKDETGESIIHISLDTDPNEVEKQVIDHANKNGFDWYFAVSPADVTNDLIDDFGRSFVNAPSAPVVLICENLSARMLDRGVKDSEELKREIEIGC